MDSPYIRRVDDDDDECNGGGGSGSRGGGGSGGGRGGSGEMRRSSDDAFDIPPKNAPIERLKRWRVSSFASCALIRSVLR